MQRGTSSARTLVGVLAIIGALSWSAMREAHAEDIYTVIAVDFGYAPSELSVLPGETRFKLINDGVRRHNLVIFRHTDGVEIASELIRPGAEAEWSVVLDQPGRYQFFCSEYSHMDRGMVGYVTVE